METIITVWEIYDSKKKELVFNHISDGYDENVAKPKSNTKIQKRAWERATWRGSKAFLQNGKVVQ